MTEDLDAYIAGAAAVLGIPLRPEWLASIRTNLEVSLRHADAVLAFDLPDEAEPAPVFRP